LPRWVSLCAAALVLFQLGGLTHLAAAPHGVCWEHGVLVDLDGASAHPESLAVPTLPGVGRAVAVHSDGHPHCPAQWVRREARDEVGASPGVFAASSPPLRARAPGPVASAGGWVLRRAPKQSPPV
jgi:hypothetical protein